MNLFFATPNRSTPPASGIHHAHAFVQQSGGIRIDDRAPDGDSIHTEEKGAWAGYGRVDFGAGPDLMDGVCRRRGRRTQDRDPDRHTRRGEDRNAGGGDDRRGGPVPRTICAPPARRRRARSVPGVPRRTGRPGLVHLLGRSGARDSRAAGGADALVARGALRTVRALGPVFGPCPRRMGDVSGELAARRIRGAGRRAVPAGPFPCRGLGPPAGRRGAALPCDHLQTPRRVQPVRDARARLRIGGRRRSRSAVRHR